MPGYAIGCDLVALSDIRESVEEFGDRFLRRMFTAGEIAASARGGGVQIERLAARFAAKEAVIKALALKGVPTPPTEIEVVGAGEAPTILLHGSIAAHASERGWSTVQVTLSHTDCHAMAMVVASIS